MAQTPQQRRANAKFQKQEEAKMGQYRAPKADKETRRKMGISERFGGNKGKPPINPIWVYLLLFVIAGGIVFELLRLFL